MSIARDQGQPFCNCLRHQHAIEWIAVMGGKRNQPACMAKSHGKLDDGGLRERFRETIQRKSQASKRLLDRHLPAARRTGKDEIGRIFYRLAHLFR